MFIIVSIYSKNLNSLTNFLKFFYQLKLNKTFDLKFHVLQSQKRKNFSFFSTLQSPHVNKKSQEQFEYYEHGKKLKIHVSQIIKFLTIWKITNILLFSDIKINTRFQVYNKVFKKLLLDKTNLDRFRLKFLKKKKLYNSATLPGRLKIMKSLKKYTKDCKLHYKAYTKKFILKHSKKEPVIKTQKISQTCVSKTIAYASLKLLDIRGEILIKNFS